MHSDKNLLGSKTGHEGQLGIISRLGYSEILNCSWRLLETVDHQRKSTKQKKHITGITLNYSGILQKVVQTIILVISCTNIWSVYHLQNSWWKPLHLQESLCALDAESTFQEKNHEQRLSLSLCCSTGESRPKCCWGFSILCWVLTMSQQRNSSWPQIIKP